MLLTIGLAIAAFLGGLVLGDLNKPSVDRAIAAMQAAEASAVATLRKISAAKTPPTTPPTAA